MRQADWTWIEETARRLGAADNQVRNWRKRGVSWPWRVKLMDEARMQRMILGDEVLARGPGVDRWSAT